MSIVSIILAVIVIGVLFWAVKSLLAAFNVGEPISTVVLVLLVLLVVVALLGGGGLNLGSLSLR